MLIKDAVKEPAKDKRRKTLDEIKDLIEKGSDPELYLKASLINGFIDSIATEMSEEDDFEYQYEQYMQKERKKEIEQVSKRYEIPEEKINQLVGDYEFGGFIDAKDIKNNLSKEVINREKELNNYPNAMRTKNNIAKDIIQFIKDLIIKFM